MKKLLYKKPSSQMKKILLTLTVLITATTQGFAQYAEGFVKDSLSNPISYATVELYQLPDTTFMGGTVTDLDGHFKLDYPMDTGLMLKFSSVGYRSAYHKVDSEMQVILQEDAKMLGELTVKAVRPISKLTPSGLLTTVENTLLSEMGTGNEVLKRIPMLQGDDGSFSVFGRGAALIYINNREVRDPSEIDNLNAKDIASVEVISNPGARYDASVMAVIKIKTTKKQGDGFSFNARSSFYTWETQDYVNQLNTNYRKGGLDVFINLYHTDITNFQRGNMSQTISVDTLWKQENIIDMRGHTQKLNGAAGINYIFNDEHAIGFRYDLKTTPRKWENAHTTSQVFADGKDFDYWNNHDRKDFDITPTSQANLYYAGKAGKMGIDLNADYMGNAESSENINTEESKAYGDRTLTSRSHINNELWAAKLVLTYPIWKGELSLGGEYTDISRKDQYIHDKLHDFSSQTNIDERTAAVFAEYQAATAVGNFSLGMRYENASYDYLCNGKRNPELSRTYGQWFPNASYSYDIPKIANLQLSYTSKVTRPSYWELSNNMTYANRFTIQTGNPLLAPSIDHHISFTALLFQFVQAQVSYSNSKNAIIQWADRYEKDPKVSILNQRNIDNIPKLLAYVAASYPVGLWQPTLTVGLQKYWLDFFEKDYGIVGKSEAPIGFVQMSNSFRLPYGIIANADLDYMSKGATPSADLSKHSLKIDLGITKSFFKDALSVKLAASDITNQGQFTRTLWPQYVLDTNYWFDSREVSLTVRYTFNAAKNKYKGTGAGSDAKGRM